jgi:hypothetical protein
MMTLESAQLIAAARKQTGLFSLGDDAILEGLQQLVDALNTEARLTERGVQSVQGILVGTLANRLRVEDYLARHPELPQRPIDRPMFVFGLPRTGTTLLINLLNEDSERRCLLRWEAFNSVPPPKGAELSSDSRYLTEQARLDQSIKHMPQISAIHHEDADSPTECQFAMAPSFCAQYYESMFNIPGYSRWFMQADYLPAFRYHKRLLQLLQSEAPGRWTLKNPWHPLFLNALTTVYPDAQLVMTHRDPVEVVGSACSLVKHVRRMFSDEVHLPTIAATLMATFDQMIERMLAYRQRHGWDSIVDVDYGALMRDPIGEVRKLYTHFNEPFTAAAEKAMIAFLANNPKGKHGRHDYSLEEFGLSNAQVREHFRDYSARFKLSRDKI